MSKQKRRKHKKMANGIRIRSGYIRLYVRQLQSCMYFYAFHAYLDQIGGGIDMRVSDVDGYLEVLMDLVAE